jgi:hypothetical protein
MREREETRHRQYEKKTEIRTEAMNSILNIVDDVKTSSRLPYRQVCGLIRVPYSSFMRLRRRRRSSEALINRPGPAKVRPQSFAQLTEEISHLQHGIKRTAGTGKLYAAYAADISRRDFEEMVSRARHEAYSAHRRNLRRIQWHVPGVVWAIDPTEYVQADPFGKSIFITNMQDLASRYKFPPLCGAYPLGKEVAAHLKRQFDAFGAPLFLKRDFGSNLNCQEVDDVLDEYCVLALNSPAYYAPYNGGIEAANGELKNCIRQKLLPLNNCQREHFKAYAEAAAHELNHKIRRSIGKMNACQTFFGTKKSFTKNERRDVFLWINDLQKDILQEKGSCVTQQDFYVARRIAVEAWLQKESYITITQNGKVSPTFFHFWSH